ncbi:hypothetical protein CVS47_02836 [Microbacterium lemovicicum]|uniref:Uncharacterized protein n=1 Tax=Microbacterium lemovicicum TaxID=1072463 RepID=A0A3Q9J0Q5_9MICO|nr:hypothetical protein [Microbacterium lemovicicum]AZS38185.1 hypothetical protein CVS47_02836 [Microbacterium lemovicicum]
MTPDIEVAAEYAVAMINCQPPAANDLWWVQLIAPTVALAIAAWSFIVSRRDRSADTKLSAKALADEREYHDRERRLERARNEKAQGTALLAAARKNASRVVVTHRLLGTDQDGYTEGEFEVVNATSDPILNFSVDSVQTTSSGAPVEFWRRPDGSDWVARVIMPGETFAFAGYWSDASTGAPHPPITVNPSITLYVTPELRWYDVDGNFVSKGPNRLDLDPSNAWYYPLTQTEESADEDV